MSPPTPVNPPALGSPRGYNNGLRYPAAGRPLFVAGQVAWDEHQRIVPGGFVAQFDRALANTLAVVAAAGGAPDSIGSMTVFVTDLDAYRACLPGLGEAWRARMGRHYPAMALVAVKGLLEVGAMVEIQSTAWLPEP